jgi:hypothetical protein
VEEEQQEDAEHYQRTRSHGLQRTDGQDLLRFLVHPLLLHVHLRVSGANGIGASQPR